MSFGFKIDDKRWAVRLSGDAIDLHEATELFGSGHQIVRGGVLVEPEAIVLQADEFELLHEAIEVYNTAERILIPVNAILYLEDPVRKPIAIASVHQRNDLGNWSMAMFPQSGSFRLRGGSARGWVGSLGTPAPQSFWVQAALNHEVVADVLSYLRGTPDWISLYKAYEAVNKDIGVLRSTKGPIAGWPSQAEISAFTRDAQLHRHSKSWNDRKGITSTGAMSFDDASALVRSMIRAWLEWRGDYSNELSA